MLVGCTGGNDDLLHCYALTLCSVATFTRITSLLGQSQGLEVLQDGRTQARFLPLIETANNKWEMSVSDIFLL